jgi:hypothetical protein
MRAFHSLEFYFGLYELEGVKRVVFEAGKYDEEWVRSGVKFCVGEVRDMEIIFPGAVLVLQSGM